MKCAKCREEYESETYPCSCPKCYPKASSETPRTDAECFRINTESKQPFDDLAEHSRKLEREINEINKLANKLWGWANMMPDENIAQLSKIIDLSGGVAEPANAELSDRRDERKET